MIDEAGNHVQALHRLDMQLERIDARIEVLPGLVADVRANAIEVHGLSVHTEGVRRDMNRVQDAVDRMTQEIKEVRVKDFPILLGLMIGNTIALAGLIAKGAGWIG